MRVDKADVSQYLDVHRNAHNLGLRTHTTMLYGSIETKEDRIRHMMQIRELQDETGGFQVSSRCRCSRLILKSRHQTPQLSIRGSEDDRHQPVDAG